LRLIFEPKREEATGRRVKLRGREYYNFYPSIFKIPMKKSRRNRWVGHEALMGEIVGTKFRSEKFMERGCLGGIE
jgi:hypothetical protein